MSSIELHCIAMFSPFHSFPRKAPIWSLTSSDPWNKAIDTYSPSLFQDSMIYSITDCHIPSHRAISKGDRCIIWFVVFELRASAQATHVIDRTGMLRDTVPPILAILIVWTLRLVSITVWFRRRAMRRSWGLRRLRKTEMVQPAIKNIFEDLLALF